MNIIIYLLLLLFTYSCTTQKQEPPHNLENFVRVKDTHFQLKGEPYFYLGTNFWYGANLASHGPGGNRERLLKELDHLSSIGVKNLRISAGSEGPDSEPWRMVPSMQIAPGKYNNTVVDGMDFLLSEMKKRDMKAVMCLNNFWPWSGGMGQYLVWAGAADSIPYPPPHPGGNWDVYPKFVSSFYTNQKAMAIFEKHIEYIINRKNAYSEIQYKDDPTIMSWELANEPRGVANADAMDKWIEKTAEYIKHLDSKHLITTGSEGNTSNQKSAGTDLMNDHKSKYIDYATMHIWVQNWDWYNPSKAKTTYPIAYNKAIKYINEHIEISKQLKKPLVLEEFGISRDLNDHNPTSTIKIRDKYYKAIFQEVYTRAVQNSSIAGCNFWAWAGAGRPGKPGTFWKVNDDFIGDPPHETQGWYSVYDTDTSTINIIKKYTAKMSEIGTAK